MKPSLLAQFSRFTCRNYSSNLKIITGAFGFSKIGCGKNETKKLPKKGSFPKPDKCGEDSFFIRESDKYVGLGVADGVSGFGSLEINSANFSRALMRHSADLIDTNVKFAKAADVIKLAFYRTIEELLIKKVNNAGASTVCIALIDKERGKVDFGNLGDSCAIILSPSEAGSSSSKYVIKHKTKTLQHDFNCPYQFTLFHEGRFIDEGHLINSDQGIYLNSGDVVLVMTDGVMDNIYDNELEQFVTKVLSKSKEDARNLSEEIALEAYKMSTDPTRISPFGVDARKEVKWEYNGGKLDDITVVSAIIQ